MEVLYCSRVIVIQWDPCHSSATYKPANVTVNQVLDFLLIKVTHIIFSLPFNYTFFLRSVIICIFLQVLLETNATSV